MIARWASLHDPRVPVSTTAGQGVDRQAVLSPPSREPGDELRGLVPPDSERSEVEARCGLSRCAETDPSTGRTGECRDARHRECPGQWEGNNQFTDGRGVASTLLGWIPCPC